MSDDGWRPPTVWRRGPCAVGRSNDGFGWYLWLGDRVQVRTRAGTTRMRPHVGVAFDEWCNRAVMVHCWPVGQVTVWVGRPLRTAADGACADCRADHRSSGVCEWCGSRPCGCEVDRGAGSGDPGALWLTPEPEEPALPAGPDYPSPVRPPEPLGDLGANSGG